MHRFAASDGLGLLILGGGAVGRGLYYSPLVADPTSLEYLAESWSALHVLSVVWMVIGALCVGAAFVWRTRFAALALGMAVGIHVLTAVSFVIESVDGHSPRDAMSALSCLVIAALALWAVGRGSREDGEGVADA